MPWQSWAWGWAAVLALENGTGHRLEISGGYRRTTNNRMEIMAVLQALNRLKESCRVKLFTDSRYVCDAVEKNWLTSWQSRGWRKKDKKPVFNADLWKRLLPLLDKHMVCFYWVRGHAGNAENERCDILARKAASSSDLPEDAGFESG